MGFYDRDYYRRERSSSWLGFNGRGEVCKWLILINVVIFMVQSLTMTPGADGREAFGPVTNALILDVNSVLHGQVWRLLTYAFLHEPGTLWHIFLNMLFLYMFAIDVEDIYGQREFLLFYLTSALLGGIGFVICYKLGVPGSLCLGASAAVMASFILCALHYPDRTILLMWILPVPIWLFALLIIVPDVYSLMMLLRYPRRDIADLGNTGTAVAAHVAGAAFAACYYKFHWRLAGLWPEIRTWQKRASRPRLRVYREEPVSAPVLTSPSTGADIDEQMEAKVDAVLEKVARQGQDSLTGSEREILLRASEAYRRRRT
jgi:membrane associated rhomboid family serine protease